MSGLFRSASAAALVSAFCWCAASSAAAFAVNSARLDTSRVFASEPSSFLSLSPAQAGAPDTIAMQLFDLPISTSGLMQLAGAPVQVAMSQVNLALPQTSLLETPKASDIHIADLIPIAQTETAPLYADSRYDVAPSVSVPQAQISAVEIQPVRFGAYQPYVPTVQSVSAGVEVPLRVGPVRFSSEIQTADVQTLQPDVFQTMVACGTTDVAAPCPYLADARAESVAASTNFHVRAGNDVLSLQLGGNVEQIRDPNLSFPAASVDTDPFARTGPPQFDQTPMLYYPGVNSIVKHGLDARIDVPVNSRLTLGFVYDTQHYQADYGSLLIPSVDAWKSTYLGNLTYALPHSSSLITLSARQYHYQDSFAPTFNLNETRATLDFTVKF